MPRSRSQIPLSDTPHSTQHTDPYAADSHVQPDGRHRRGDRIPVADGKQVPGFQMKTSTGPLWRALSLAKGEEEMVVVKVHRGASFQGISGLVELECSLEGFDYTVLAYYKGSRRIA